MIKTISNSYGSYGKEYELSCEVSCTSSSSFDQIVECCQTDNCNEVKIPPIVTSCYRGQYVIMDGQEDVIIPVTKQTCISPQNQYCSVKTTCIDTGILKKNFGLGKMYRKYTGIL